MMREDIYAGLSLIMHMHGDSNEPVSLDAMHDGEISIPDILDSTDLYELTRNYIVYLTGGEALIESNGRERYVKNDKALIQLTIATMKVVEEEIEHAETIQKARKSTINRLGQLCDDLYDNGGLEKFTEETGLPKYLGNPFEMVRNGASIKDDIEAAQVSVRIMQQIASNYFDKAASYEPAENRVSQNPAVQEIIALKVA